MSLAPADENSIIVIVLGPVVIATLVTAVVLWLRERQKKKDG